MKKRKENTFTRLMVAVVMIGLFVAMFSPLCTGTGNPAQADNPAGEHTISLSPENPNQAQAEPAEAEKEEPPPGDEEPLEAQTIAEKGDEIPVPLIVEKVRKISAKATEPEPEAQATEERAEGKLFKEAVIWMLTALLVVLLITLVAVCLLSVTISKVNMGVESLCRSNSGISDRTSLILQKLNKLGALPDTLAALTKAVKENKAILQMLLTEDVLIEEIRNALKAGDRVRLEAFQSLEFLPLPSDVNAPMDSLNNTLLHIALFKDTFSLNAVKWICEKYKDTLKFDQANEEKITAMDLARERLKEVVEENEEDTACEMFRLFREAGLYPDVNARVTKMKSSLVHLAAHRNMVNLLNLLKEANADFNLKNDNEHTPKDMIKDILENAVEQKDKNKLEELLKLGLLDKELINKKWFEGERSLLHLAADAGAIDIFELLVENGGNVDLADRHDYTPKDLAFNCLTRVKEDETGLFERLWFIMVLNKDNINKVTDERSGNTLAHLAAIRGLTKVYGWLEEHGADVNKLKNKIDQQTPNQIILSKLAEAQQKQKDAAAESQTGQDDD